MGLPPACGRPYAILEDVPELNTTSTLLCRTCGLTKADSDFPLRTTAGKNRRGRDWQCRACKAAYYRKNKAVMSAQTRASNINRRYGISVDEYDALIAQGCSACGTMNGRIVLDHCHATGRIRGPLCDRCNKVLAKVSDDPHVLRRLAEHAEKANGT